MCILGVPGAPGGDFRKSSSGDPGPSEQYLRVVWGIEISGAKHSPLSSGVWWHQIAETQVSRINMFRHPPEEVFSSFRAMLQMVHQMVF